MKPRFFPRALRREEIEALIRGDINPVRCKRCNFWFTNRSELMRHIWDFHRRKKGGGNS